jgi:hypothetical protein
MINNEKEELPWILPKPKSRFSVESSFRTARPDNNIQLPLSSLVVDESPSDIVRPNTKELRNITKMILNLQLELKEERSKRECLEEKVSKFESQQTPKSHEITERKWRLSDTQNLDEEIPKNQSFLPAPDKLKDVDQKIGELRSHFDLRLQNLDQSLLEIRSILATNPVGVPKSDKKTSLEAGRRKDKDCNRFLYKKLERGVFPGQISLKNAIIQSVDELLNKPWSEKTEIENIMDQYYLDNLPAALLQPVDKQNEDPTPMTALKTHLFLQLDSRKKIL